MKPKRRIVKLDEYAENHLKTANPNAYAIDNWKGEPLQITALLFARCWITLRTSQPPTSKTASEIGRAHV